MAELAVHLMDSIFAEVAVKPVAEQVEIAPLSYIIVHVLSMYISFFIRALPICGMILSLILLDLYHFYPGSYHGFHKGHS